MKLTTYIKNRNFSLVTYFCLVIIRIVLVFIPQYAIIHPDEFFQTSEVITGIKSECKKRVELMQIITHCR